MNLPDWRHLSQRCWLALNTWVQLGQEGRSADYSKGTSLFQTKWEHISWELLQESEGHLAAVFRVGPDTKSSQKYNFSLLIHPLPPLVLLFLLISYLQIHLHSPGVSHLSSTTRGGWVTWSSQEHSGVCALPSIRFQTGGVTRPLPTQLLQKNRDSI